MLRVKPSIYILEEEPSSYIVLATATRRIMKFEVDDLVREIINLCAQKIEPKVLVNTLDSKYSLEDIHLCLEALRKFGIIEEDLFYPNKRFAKQVAFISELTGSFSEAIDLQKRIENSKIAIFGVGGIGSWVVNGLAQIGIGEIRICDPDIVSETNLNRQLHFTSADIGKPKVSVLKTRIPDSNILTYTARVSNNEDLEEIIQDTNFIVNCADFPSVQETTKIIDSYARRLGIAYTIAGGYNMHLGMVGPIIVPGFTACFDCFLRTQKENDPLSKLKVVKDVEDSGNLGPIAGAIANIQVMEILKYIINRGEHNFNRFAEIDFLSLRIDWRDYDKHPECYVCNKV